MNTVGISDLPDMSLDYETGSACDLTKEGSRRYARHESTVVNCLSWKPGDEVSNLWVPGMPIPERLLHQHRNGGMFRAWNAPFETDISQHVMIRHGLPFIDGGQFVCTQAEALAMALPASLDGAAKALKLPIQKDMDGHKLMMKYAKPKPDGTLWTYWDDPIGFDYYYGYCLNDTDTEHGVASKIRRLPPWELEIYHVTRRMNERGVKIDLELVNAAQKMVAQAMDLLDEELRDITGYCHHRAGVSTFGAAAQLKEWFLSQGVVVTGTGRKEMEKLAYDENTPENVRQVAFLKLRGKEFEKDQRDLLMQQSTGYIDRVDGVPAATSVELLKDWIVDRLGPEYMASHDLELEKLAKEDVADLLVLSDLPNSVRRALEIRQERGKASVGKLKAMQERVSPSGRIERMWRYAGATTLRWSGAGSRVQLQNMKRPNPDLDIDEAIKDILAGDIQVVRDKHGSPMDVVADIMRGTIVAEDGYELLDADESQIEARVLATIAGEHKAVEAFRAYDRKEGPDIYSIAAAGIYGLPLCDVSKDLHRPTGKIAILGLGFAGGAGAILKMARANRVDLSKIFDGLMDASPEAHQMAMFEAWEQRGIRSGVKKIDWQCAELIKVNWRTDNPNIVAYWAEVERAAIQATLNKGRVFKAGCVAYQHVGGFLRVRVPKGGFIYYPGAFVETELTEWGTERHVLKAMGQGLNNQWEPYRLTKLVLIENIVQRIARDVLAEVLLVLDKDPEIMLTMTVHDEWAAEVEEGKGKILLPKVLKLMSTPVPWLPELPLAAAGWHGPRFRK